MPSTYGMAATNPAKDDIIFKDGTYQLAGKSLQDLLEANGKHPYISYQWSPWVTSWARFELELGIRLVGAENFVYCDTDSVKYVGSADWSELNRQKMLASAMSGAFAMDAKGQTHYMGVWEPDGVVDKFRTLGAKKYCSETDGKIKLTLAGVTKRTGGSYLQERGGIEAFDIGFVFEGEEVAGVEAIYNDQSKPLLYETEDGHQLEIPRNVYLQPSKYELSAGWDYSQLIKRCHNIFEYRDRNHDLNT